MADLHGAEQLLRHPVAVTLTDPTTAVMIAASVAGDPPRTRLAWIDWRAVTIAARLVCPPSVPSVMRPVVATDVRLEQAGIDDRVIAMRAADGVASLQLVVADDERPPVAAVGPEGVALVRLDPDTPVVAIDAVSPSGEPVGRLDSAGIGFLTLAAGRITGRLGVTHGLAAGFGAGHWVADAEEAAFESGFIPFVPGWVPEGLTRGMFHIEPDVAYPAAPPSIVVAWGKEPGRVLVRQTPGMLASPDHGSARSETVQVGEWRATLLTRGRFATLVWQAADRAIGIQVSGLDAPGDVAQRVAASM